MHLAKMTVLVSMLAVYPALAQQVLKKEPPAGALPGGNVVLVDDGACPKGQIKQVVGGSNMGTNSRGGQRTRSCVPRK